MRDAYTKLSKDGVSYGYPDGYAPKSIDVQVRVLRELFPELGSAPKDIARHPLPEHAEGWFAIPKWSLIAPTYVGAVIRVLAVLSCACPLYNWRCANMSARHLKQSDETAAGFRAIGEAEQGHDILVIPAQFGFRYRGRSVHKARTAMGAGEFGLGAFAVGIMLLTHPDRLACSDHLYVHCPGDCYAPEGHGHFTHAPLFAFYAGKLRFDAYFSDGIHAHYGSVSGFRLI